MTYYFQKAATDTWNVYVTANGDSAERAATAAPVPITTITLAADGSAPDRSLTGAGGYQRAFHDHVHRAPPPFPSPTSTLDLSERDAVRRRPSA